MQTTKGFLWGALVCTSLGSTAAFSGRISLLGRAQRARALRIALAAGPEPEIDAVPRFKPRRSTDADLYPEGDGPSEADLLSDIARFKQRESASAALSDGRPDVVMSVINSLGLILTCNFVIIVGLFGWFIVGAVAQLGFKSMAPITAFRGAWDPFILPLLSTHMGLTFLSKFLEKIFGKEPEGSIGGNWDIKL
jgi:hypothetical protein